MEQDKYIRQIAEQHETPVDFEQLWDKLEPHVPQKKRRVPVFIWFWTIGVTLVSLGLWLMFDNQKTSPVASIINQNTGNSNKSVLEKSSNVDKGTNQKNESIKSIDQNKNLTQSNQNIATKAENILKTEVPNRQNQTKKLTNQSNVKLDESIIISNNQISNVDSEIKNIETESHIKTAFGTPIYTQVQTNISNDLISVEDEKRTNEVVDFLPIIETPLDLENRFLSNKISLSNKKNYNVLFQVGAGFFTLKNTIQNNASAENSLFLQAEQPLEYLTASVTTDIRLTNRWFLQSGLRYRRFATQLQNDFSSYTSTTTQGITEIIIDESGFASNVQGALSNTTTTTIRSKWHSYYHYIDVHISIRYLLVNTYRHKFYIEGGAILQVWSGAQGGYISPNGQLQKYDFTSNPYRTNRLGYSGGIAWEWSVSRRGALSTGLSYDWRSMERSEASMNIKTSISSYRMNLGYRINF